MDHEKKIFDLQISMLSLLLSDVVIVNSNGQPQNILIENICMALLQLIRLGYLNQVRAKVFIIMHNMANANKQMQEVEVRDTFAKQINDTTSLADENPNILYDLLRIQDLYLMPSAFTNKGEPTSEFNLHSMIVGNQIIREALNSTVKVNSIKNVFQSATSNWHFFRRNVKVYLSNYTVNRMHDFKKNLTENTTKFTNNVHNAGKEELKEWYMNDSRIVDISKKARAFDMQYDLNDLDSSKLTRYEPLVQLSFEAVEQEWNSYASNLNRSLGSIYHDDTLNHYRLGKQINYANSRAHDFDVTEELISNVTMLWRRRHADKKETSEEPKDRKEKRLQMEKGKRTANEKKKKTVTSELKTK